MHNSGKENGSRVVLDGYKPKGEGDANRGYKPKPDKGCNDTKK